MPRTTSSSSRSTRSRNVASGPTASPKRPGARAGLVGLLLLGACATLDVGSFRWAPENRPPPAAPVAPREPCEAFHPERAAFFGDLHVHTGYSMDARTRDLVLRPSDAYRYARGETVDLPPLDEAGRGLRAARIDRPLDFAAVTDHAEWLGEVSLCTDPASDAFDTKSCRTYRGERRPWWARLLGLDEMTVRLMGLRPRAAEVCAEGGEKCRARALSVWEDIQAAAEQWYDRTSACRFTTFHGWEYSASPDLNKVHRNVLFRNERVPELPISWIDEPTPEGLWRTLRRLCNDSGSGCDALAIPHNPNLSSGHMFSVPDRDEALSTQRSNAALRAEMEPIVEMFQAKGDSECRNGLFDVLGGEDELCDFEKIRGLDGFSPSDCEEGTGTGALAGFGCVSRLDYVRYALVEGLREERRLGVNPYRFGFIGSTDTHNATPGAVDEDAFEGTRGATGATARSRLSQTTRTIQNELRRNPGGLAGVWAEENTRDSIFDALRRREAFATSGPRITPRFFGGWELPGDWCERADWIEVGYSKAVPMGSELAPGSADPPVFGVAALADPGTDASPGWPLERLQVVKGFFDPDGRFHQRVYDVAGEASDSEPAEECSQPPPGARSLCAVWRDPDFRPERAAVYYARVVEAPSCRWSWRQCLEFPEDARPVGCRDDEEPRSIRERAWTSPIWYSPASRGS